MNVFAYGTLMHPDVMRVVTGSLRTYQSALLPGYARYRVRGEFYPGLIPAQAAQTSGVLYRGLVRTEVRKLDAFEGVLYERRRVLVRLAGGEWLEAQAYVVVPSCRHRLSDQPWSLDAFARRHVEQFMGRYSGFRRAARRRKAASARDAVAPVT